MIIKSYNKHTTVPQKQKNSNCHMHVHACTRIVTELHVCIYNAHNMAIVSTYLNMWCINVVIVTLQFYRQPIALARAQALQCHERRISDIILQKHSLRVWANQGSDHSKSFYFNAETQISDFWSRGEKSLSSSFKNCLLPPASTRNAKTGPGGWRAWYQEDCRRCSRHYRRHWEGSPFPLASHPYR